MKRRLLIDDVRGWQEVAHDYIPEERLKSGDEFVLARTFGEGLAQLQQGGWDELYLDHDLGFDGDGYDIMLWLERRPSFVPPCIIFVTANPFGRANMESVHKRLRKRGLVR